MTTPDPTLEARAREIVETFHDSHGLERNLRNSLRIHIVYAFRDVIEEAAKTAWAQSNQGATPDQIAAAIRQAKETP